MDVVIKTNYEPIQKNEYNDEHCNEDQDDSLEIHCNEEEILKSNDHFKTKSKIKTENARITINHVVHN